MQCGAGLLRRQAVCAFASETLPTPPLNPPHPTLRAPVGRILRKKRAKPGQAGSGEEYDAFFYTLVSLDTQVGGACWSRQASGNYW